jgi:hypothetical protein
MIVKSAILLLEALKASFLKLGSLLLVLGILFQHEQGPGF